MSNEPQFFIIEESNYKICDNSSPMLDRPSLMRPFTVDNNYNSIFAVCIFARKEDAINFYNNTVIPASINLVIIPWT